MAGLDDALDGCLRREMRRRFPSTIEHGALERSDVLRRSRNARRDVRAQPP
jgi:hypothetical protein